MIVAALVVAGSGGTAPRLEAQAHSPMGRRPRIVWRAEVGAAASTPLVEDGNGVTVRRGIGPLAGADALIAIDRRSAVLVTVRAASGTLGVRSSGRRWSAGASHQFDLAVKLERALPAAIVAAVGVALSHLRGAADVVPFRTGSGSITTWSTEATLARRLSSSRPIDGVLSGDILRIAGQARESPELAAGWVGRIRLGLRYAR